MTDAQGDSPTRIAKLFDQLLGIAYERWATVGGGVHFSLEDHLTLNCSPAMIVRIYDEIAEHGMLDPSGPFPYATISAKGITEVENRSLASTKSTRRMRDEREVILKIMENYDRFVPTKDLITKNPSLGGPLGRHALHMFAEGLLKNRSIGTIEITLEGRKVIRGANWDDPAELRASIHRLLDFDPLDRLVRTRALELTRVPPPTLTKWGASNPALLIRDERPHRVLVGPLRMKLEEVLARKEA